MKKKEKRIAIIFSDKCRPKKCQLECKKSCPIVKIGQLCIQVSHTDHKASICELQCIGCGICIKKCPFSAIQIINLPIQNNIEIVHKYGINSFQLLHLPVLKQGFITGIIGSNGIGKSTALKILAGEIKPNLGDFRNFPNWKTIKKFFKGSDLQTYFEHMNKEKVHIKPQYIDAILELECNLSIEKIFFSIDRFLDVKLVKELSLFNILKRKIHELSGGELQRFAIACVLIQKKGIFLFDELSSYLDIKQRLQIVQVVKNLMSIDKNNYIAIIEHDLAMADYLSDFICCLYGIPGAYGITSSRFSVKEGINIFLSGFIPTENIRFRPNSICFINKNKSQKKHTENTSHFFYPAINKTLESFQLNIEGGIYSKSEIIVLLGENGMGKTLFMKSLGMAIKTKKKISYKPQRIFSKLKCRVKELIFKKNENTLTDSFFKNNLFEPFQINLLLDKKVENLSGGELQNLSLFFCLTKDSDLYLIDEPSSYLDSEQRLVISKILKKFFLIFEKSAFVVEHDFIIATYLADKIIVFEGTPSLCSKTGCPVSVNEGINKFLKQLDITFRKDPISFFPRINRLNSLLDREQKSRGDYYFNL